MAVELTREEFAIAEGFFNKTMFQIPALAVINSSFPGKVFVDNKENPRTALVWAYQDGHTYRVGNSCQNILVLLWKF